jgi:NodT family efflux transporter outer membrane factor (OMF) lipoprotein
MSGRYWKACCALLPALAGCTLGPNFARPDQPQDAGFTNQAPPAAASPAAGSLRQEIVYGQELNGDWWEVFKSPALNEVVGDAVAGNRTLASMTETLLQAQELAAAASGALYPQIGVNAGVGRQKYGAQFLGSFKVPPFTYFAVGPTVSYALDYDGLISRGIEQRHAVVDYTREQKEAAYLTVTGQAVMEVINLASARAQISVLEQLLAQDQQNLKLVQNAFDEGSVARIDLVSAQSQIASDMTLFPPLRQEMSRATHALSILTGKTPAAGSIPTIELADLVLPASIPVSLPSALAHHRPDVLAAEAQLHAATAAVGIADANLYPRIQLTASLGQQSLHPEQLFNASSTAWSLISGLTAPVFDGGSLRAQKRASVDALRASAADYQQSVLEAFGQVADLLDALDHDAEQLDAQTQAREAARTAVELARASYAEGNAGILQVLDAQRVYQQSGLGFVRSLAQRYLDTAQLILALGGTPIGGTLPTRSE